MSEQTLRDIAKQYAKEAGTKYQAENAELPPAATPGLDAKMKAKENAMRRKAWLLRSRVFVGVAASLIVAVVVWFTILPVNEPALTLEYAVRATMPAMDTLAPAAIPLPPAEAVPDAAQSWVLPAPATPLPDSEFDEDMAFRQMLESEQNIEFRMGQYGGTRGADQGSEMAMGVPAMPPGENFGTWAGGGMEDSQEVAQDVLADEWPVLYYLAAPPGWVQTERYANTFVFQREDDEMVVVNVTVSIIPLFHDLHGFRRGIVLGTVEVFLLEDDVNNLLFYYHEDLRFTLTTKSGLGHLFEFVLAKLQQ